MNKIMELRRKYPANTYISTYFIATFVVSGAIAWSFDRSMWEALLLAGVTSVTSGISAAVKQHVDKDNETE